ncbi:hypothetical protein CerSpe_162520 [Prunus speciosa]
MGSDEKSKILIIGATGYLGKFMVKASLSFGHPTYAYVRPIKPSNDSSRLELLKEFEAMGLTIFQGELDEHEKLVAALKQVDVVISALPIPQLLEQFKIINAIKDAGNIKRFIPAEFGNDPARESTLAPFGLSMRIEGRLEGLQKQQKFPTLMCVETHLDPILLVIYLILMRKGTKSLFMALVKPRV